MSNSDVTPPVSPIENSQRNASDLPEHERSYMIIRDGQISHGYYAKKNGCEDSFTIYVNDDNEKISSIKLNKELGFLTTPARISYDKVTDIDKDTRIIYIETISHSVDDLSDCVNRVVCENKTAVKVIDDMVVAIFELEEKIKNLEDTANDDTIIRKKEIELAGFLYESRAAKSYKDQLANVSRKIEEKVAKLELENTALHHHIRNWYAEYQIAASQVNTLNNILETLIGHKNDPLHLVLHN